MIDRAALIWGVKPEDVAYDAGVLRCKSDDAKRFTSNSWPRTARDRRHHRRPGERRSDRRRRRLRHARR